MKHIVELKRKLLFAWIILFPLYSIGQQCGTLPAIFLGNDTVLCNGQILQLNLTAYSAYDHILWDNGSSALIRVITTPGTYNVKATAVGNNLVVNGNFDGGNTGFTTQYTVGTGGSWGLLSSPGTYAISTSPSNVHNNFVFCQDHTGNNGNMLIVNGSSNPGIEVWCQTITVTPNTDYEFSTWVTNVVNNPDVADLQFSINGAPLGNIFSPSTNACNWLQFYQQWNSGIQTNAQICITNNNTVDSGNDFAIDDIYFAPVCVSEDTITASYLPYPTFTTPPVYNACDGDTLVLDAENPGLDYLWANADTNQQISVTSSGVYQVAVSTNGLCELSKNFNVNFNTPPNAGNDSLLLFCNTEQNVDLFNLLPPTVTQNGTWMDSNQTIVNNGITSILNNEGLMDYFYITTQQYCPSDTANYTLDIKHFTDAGQPFLTHICNENDIVLANYVTGGTNGIWESVDGFSMPRFNQTSSTFDLDSLLKDDYVFRYIIQNESPCPADTAIFTISVSEIPYVVFTADTTEGCSPLSIQFIDLTEVNGTKNYEWYVEGSQVGEDEPTLSYTFVNQQTYDIGLKITTDNLCVKDTTFTDYIVVNPNPVADFTFTPEHIFSDNPKVNFENKSGLNAQNIWSFAGLDSSYDINPVYTFPVGEQNEYTVYLKVVSAKNCIDSISKVVSIKTNTLFFIPNAFTPDGDGYNNVFKPVMSANVDPNNYHFSVFNRWGEILFESFNFNTGWKGTYGGKTAPDGVYVWKLSFKELYSDKIISKHGTITLVR